MRNFDYSNNGWTGRSIWPSIIGDPRLRDPYINENLFIQKNYNLVFK